MFGDLDCAVTVPLSLGRSVINGHKYCV